MNKKIFKLENNKEYFMISELTEDNTVYFLLMNVDDESDIKIMKQLITNGEEYLTIVKENEVIANLKGKFKSLVDSDKKNILN